MLSAIPSLTFPSLGYRNKCRYRQTKRVILKVDNTLKEEVRKEEPLAIDSQEHHGKGTLCQSPITVNWPWTQNIT